MTKQELQAVLGSHKQWLLGDASGVRAYLRGAYLRGAYLRGANLRGADLRRAYLSGANLRRAYLSGAYLSGADLSGADLRAAKGLLTEVAIPGIHSALLAACSREGALDMSTWHSCETTHCRAGWVITLAGKPGAALEGKLGTNAAAALIYYASDPNLKRVPNWTASNEEAMKDMRRLAGKLKGPVN